MTKTIFHGIINIRLHAFRCYGDTKINLPKSRLIGIYGQNGTGKTSILDAISIFADTKYFTVKYEDLLSWQQTGDQWVLAFQLLHNKQMYCIKCCFNRQKIPKVMYFINDNQASLEEIQRKFSVIGMYPKLFRNLIDHASCRRNWLDKWVDMLDCHHYDRCLEYKKITQQRLKLLQKPSLNNYDNWLSALENRLSELAVAICAQRLYWVKLMHAILQHWSQDQLPLVGLQLIGEIEEYLLKNSRAVEVEHMVRKKFNLNRPLDREIYSTNLGPGCSKIKFTIDNLPLKLSSHGQQQLALLILTAAQADCLYRQCGKLSIMLLDDMHAYLDENITKKLQYLYQKLPNQIWTTSVNIKNLKCIFGSCMQTLHIKQSDQDKDRHVTLV